MSQHIGETTLRAFVAGTQSEEDAVDIAVHLDDCPSCSRRAEALDPLTAVFATVRAPRTPPELAARILVHLDRPDPSPTREIAIGVGLLGGALVLAWASGSPWTLAAEFGVVVDRLASLARGLAIGLSSAPVALALATLVALAGSILTFGFVALPSDHGRLSPVRRSS